MRTRPLGAVAGLALGLATALTVSAQAQLDGDRSESGSGQGRNIPGEFDYLTLVLSWSPTYCATPDGGDDALQCRRNDGRRYGFVLHGLWPQYERGFPERCLARRRAYVPGAVIDGMLDIMPSPKLVIHEYRAHGTCSGLDPAGFFELSRRLFGKVVVPERYLNPFESQFVSPAGLVDELVDNNPGLEPGMVAVACAGPGHRLTEVRVCFTRDGEYRTCGANEDQSRLCPAGTMFVPPVRSSRAGPNSDEDRERPQRAPLPKPRTIQSPR